MRSDADASIDDFARRTRFITGALAFSVVVYVVVAWIVAPVMTSDAADARRDQLLAIVFAVLSAGQLVAARIIHEMLLGRARHRATPRERLGEYRSAVIVAFALREGVALYGLVLSFLSGEPRWAIGFGAVALFSMAAGWPRRSVMEELAAEVPPIG